MSNRYTVNGFLKNFDYKDVNNYDCHPYYKVRTEDLFYHFNTLVVDYNSKEEYQIWKKTWKKVHHILVAAIKKAKKNRDDSHLILSELATQMYFNLSNFKKLNNIRKQH